LVNTKEKGSKFVTEETINVDELAHEFAAIPNTVNLFLFIACRKKCKVYHHDDEVNEKFSGKLKQA
jgi:hypothetical protein